MDRRALIERKRQELYGELSTWAKTSQILRPGEFLYVTIGIMDAQEAVVVLAQDAAPIEPEYRSEESRTLEAEDWQKLLDCPWSNPHHKELIKLLCERNNLPISKQDIRKNLKFEWKNGYTKSVNSVISRFLNSQSRGYHPRTIFGLVQIDKGGMPSAKRRVCLRKWVDVPM